MGRPISGYTDATADLICERVCGGETLKSVCLALAIPFQTVCKWERNNLNGFGGHLNDARRSAAGLLQDEIIDIANDCPLNTAAVARATMQIKARQWLIEHLHPNKLVIPAHNIEDDNVVRPQDFLKLWQAKNQPQKLLDLVEGEA